MGKGYSLQRGQSSLGNPAYAPSMRHRSILDPVPPFSCLFVVTHATDPQLSVGRPATVVYLLLVVHLFSAVVLPRSLIRVRWPHQIDTAYKPRLLSWEHNVGIGSRGREYQSNAFPSTDPVNLLKPSHSTALSGEPTSFLLGHIGVLVFFCVLRCML